MKRINFYNCATLIWFFVILCVSSSVQAFEVGAQAPGFMLRSIQDEEVRLSDFKGSLVLLKIGTTWCPGCKTLGEEIDKLVPVLKEREVVVLDVFVQDTAPMIQEALKGKTPYARFHALLDDGSVYSAYGVYLIPRLLVIDEKQVVRYDSAGQELSAKEIETMIETFTQYVEGSS